MKHIYTFAILILAGLSTNAQNFVFSTTQNVDSVMGPGYTSSYIRFTTPQPEQITYKYETLSNTMPAGWDLSLCDYVACYVGVPAEETMVQISIEDYNNGIGGYFNLSAGHQGIEGEGTIVIYVHDLLDQSRGDTVSWHYSYDGSNTAIEDVVNHPEFQLYPNPASDFVQISLNGNYVVSIYNTLGKLERTATGSNLSTINLEGLVSGIHLVSIQTKEGDLINRRLMVK
jgi:hypothetical protein